MRKLLPIILLALPLSLLAQSTNITTLFKKPVKKADFFYKRLAYRNALNLYLRAHDKKPQDAYVMEQIAECYFKLHDPVNAEVWYDKISSSSSFTTQSKLDFAEALSMNGKYDESKTWFEAYLKENPASTSVREKIEFLDRIEHYINDTTDFVILSADFNTEHSEYGAHYFHDGLVFASSRDDDFVIEHKASDAVVYDESLLNMFYVEGKTYGEYKKARPLHNTHIKSFLHEGPMAFYNNDLRAGFTRTNMKPSGRPIRGKDKLAHLQIYFADVAQLSSMSNITPFQHNNRDYSLAHPSFSPDGSIMYFTSTAPGGFGSSDIYVSRNSNGDWSAPENLGPVINTPNEESFPYLANDSVLYFSSNGHGSLGGMDILVSYKRRGKFGKPVNLGSPINSRYDDFSFVTDKSGHIGYFSSNRPGGRGLDDIYYFASRAFFLVGRSVDTKGQILNGVKLVAIDKATGLAVDSARSDANGYFDLRMPLDKDIDIVATKDGYVSLNKNSLRTSGFALAVDSLSIALWKQSLFAKGKLYDNETQQPLTGVTVTVRNVDTGAQSTIELGDLSSYDVKLLPDSRFSISFTKPGYLTRVVDVDTKNRMEGELLHDVILEREFADMVTIGFAYNKSIVSADAKKVLEQIVKTLAGNPSTSLNIGAHADARGSVAYNQQLTNARARNTMKYFTSKGIDQKRITWKGFGEKLLLNQCTDGIKCTDEQHKINRRAEVKVIR